MKVKGTAVKTIPEFIQLKHPDKYAKWMKELPASSRAIFDIGVKASEWYDIQDAIIEPTRLMSEVCFGHPTIGAWECGRYSAEASLTGIYKFYVKMSSPAHIISRAGRVLQAYYEPSELEIVDKGDKYVTVHITDFSKPHDVIDHRFAGWMERALEVSGCQNVNVKLPKAMSKGHPITEFAITWN